jgi:hypothetical protein
MTCVAGRCECPAPVVDPSVVVASVAPESIVRGASDGTNLALAWFDAGGYLRFVLIDGATGAVVPGSRTDLGFPHFRYPEVDIVWTGSEYVVAWVGPFGSIETSIVIRRVSATGAPLAPEFDVGLAPESVPRPLDQPRLAHVSGIGLALLARSDSGTWNFQLLGLDGTTPQRPTHVGFGTGSAELAGAADGFTSLTKRRDSVHSRAQLIGIDGTLAGPYRTILGGRDIAHDGAGWIAAGYDAGYVVYRGAADFAVATPVAVPAPVGLDRVVMDVRSGRVVVVHPDAGALFAQRFAVPAGPDEPLVALPPRVRVSDVAPSGRGFVAASIAGDRLLTAWIDTASPAQMRVARASLGTCP